MMYAAIWESAGRYLVAEIFDTPNNEPIELHRAQGQLELGQWQWFATGGQVVEPGWIAEREGDDWSFVPYFDPPVPESVLASNARAMRDQLLRDNYDRGILMAQRYIRLALTPEEISYAEGKIAELDSYAQALQEIPDQPGFPQTITWPTAPTK